MTVSDFARSAISKQCLKADRVEKSTTSQGRLFHMLMTRSVIACFIDYLTALYTMQVGISTRLLSVSPSVCRKREL